MALKITVLIPRTCEFARLCGKGELGLQMELWLTAGLEVGIILGYLVGPV